MMSERHMSQRSASPTSLAHHHSGEVINMTTKTTQFTPGPLKAVQIIIENSPCTWAVQRKSMREQWGKPSIATYIDNEADANLFAAAPAMYEALQGALKNIDRLNDKRSAYRAQWIKAVQVALAQAEGR